MDSVFRIRISFLFVFIFIICGVNVAHASGKYTMAVLGFQANNTEAAYGRIICNQMEVSLYRTGYFELIERKQIDVVLDEQGFQQAGLTETSTAAEMGKLLSADYVVTGSIDRMETFIITARAIDTRSGTVAFADSIKAASEDKIQEALDTLARNMAEGIYTKKGLRVIDSDQYRSRKRMNGWLALGTGVIGVTSFGLGIYSNTVVNEANDEYSSLAEQYRTATLPADIQRLESGMKTQKDRADEYVIYRNVSYGVGAAAILASAYFLYRYLTIPEPPAPSVSYNYPVPVVYSLNPAGYRGRGIRENYLGLGVIWHF